MIRRFSKVVPVRVRGKLRGRILGALGQTVSQGYENYARGYKSSSGAHLGDEWQQPGVIGMDVPADQVVPTLDEKVFRPFLGTCDVILEIGAGGGRFTEILFPKCQKVIASDTSPAMLSLLRQRFAGNLKLECLVLDGRGLGSIQDQSVDAAFSYDVFNHIEHWDIFNYLCEIRRVLKPGGKAVIHHANTFSELGWKRFVTETPQQVNLPKIWGTFSLMSPEIFKELSERAGLLHRACITNLVRRDGISLLESPAG